MSWNIVRDAFASVQSRDDLTSSEAFLLIALANYCDEQGRNAFPSMNTLMAITKFAESTLREALGKLKKKQLVTTITHRGRTGWQRYTLRLSPAGKKGPGAGPLPKIKGPGAGVKKGQELETDPVPEIQIPLPSSSLPSSSPTISQEDMERHLRFLGVSPDSTIYQAALHPYDHNGH